MEAFLEEEALYRMALTRVPGIGPAYTKKLVTHFGDARSVFRAKQHTLEALGAKEDVAAAIVSFSKRQALETELHLLEKKGVRLLFFTDAEYPQRLCQFSDTPPLLFYRGNADLNATRVVAVVGTRNPSDYGRQVTAQLIGQMAQPGMLIISGLALGIDTVAHRAALNVHLPTIGILGHGFGHLYPQENESLAKAMIHNGGLLSSFAYADKPAAWHFPDRNAVVAALCDALVVVETGRKGGSLLTVNAAQKYARRIFAVPGRITDTRSAGCNWLIRQEMALMLTSGEQLAATMRWNWPEGATGIQASLRLSSTDTGPAKPDDSLLQLLKEKDSFHIDEIAARTGHEPSALALLLLKLELGGLVCALPGKRYRSNVAVIQS
jgi:DNA processing protein